MISEELSKIYFYPLHLNNMVKNIFYGSTIDKIKILENLKLLVLYITIFSKRFHLQHGTFMEL